MRTHVDLISQAMSHLKHIGHLAAHISHVDLYPDTRHISSCVIMEKCRPRGEHNFHFLPPHDVKDGTVFTSFSCALGCIGDLLLDLSHFLGLAPVFRCHRESFDTLEAGTRARSRA